MVGRRGFLTGLGALAAASAAGCSPDEPAPTPTPTPTPDSYRPRFHYTPAAGNLADPNGLVLAEGTFHLFHQSDGRWAHATAPDLVHWTRRGIALDHDRLGQALSGSAVVDGDRLVAAYTSTEGGEAQCLAFGSLTGTGWRRYEGNPVIANDGRRDFRDPKIIWHSPTRRWVMLVAAGDVIELFTSTDLLHWQHASRFGADRGLHSAVWECPGLVELRVHDSVDTRWVLFVSVGDSAETDGSVMQYFVGTFDGTTFVPDEGAGVVRLVDHGQDFYAGQTWFGLPDRRVVWLAWMGNWRYPYQLPTGGWRGTMSVPRELGLHRQPNGSLILVQQPVVELESLRGRTTDIRPGPVEGMQLVEASGTSLDIELDLQPGIGRSGLRLLGTSNTYTEVGIDRDAATLYVDRSRSGLTMITDRSGAEYELPTRTVALPDPDARARLRILIDQTTIEVFDNRGPVLSCVVLPPANAGEIVLFDARGGTWVHALTIHEMKPIWA